VKRQLQTTVRFKVVIILREPLLIRGGRGRDTEEYVGRKRGGGPERKTFLTFIQEKEDLFLSRHRGKRTLGRKKGKKQRSPTKGIVFRPRGKDCIFIL